MRREKNPGHANRIVRV